MNPILVTQCGQLNQRQSYRRVFSGSGFSEKCLTGSVVCLIQDDSRDDTIAHGEEEISMMTSRTYKEHLAKWQPSAAMRGACLRTGLSAASDTLGVNIFNGRLGQATSIGSRYIRQ